MGALKIVGGILAVAGAGLVLFMQILALMDVGFTMNLLYLMVFPILALIGGILALAGKRAGGIIALVVGIIWLTIAILLNVDVISPFEEWLQFVIQSPFQSFFIMYVGIVIWGFLTVETILVFVGGILATAGGSEE